LATKPHRGKTLWTVPARGRGTCPICGSTRIKLLYDKAGEDGKSSKVCKKCRGA